MLSRDFFLLLKLATILGDNAQLLARAQEAFGQLAMIGGVVAVEQGLVSALHHVTGDIHDVSTQFERRHDSLGIGRVAAALMRVMPRFYKAVCDLVDGMRFVAVGFSNEVVLGGAKSVHISQKSGKASCAYVSGQVAQVAQRETCDAVANFSLVST